MQPLEIVGRRFADRGIETGFALACGQDVPQAEAVREKARQTVAYGNAYRSSPTRAPTSFQN
jgi:hypothetical protein